MKTTAGRHYSHRVQEADGVTDPCAIVGLISGSERWISPLGDYSIWDRVHYMITWFVNSLWFLDLPCHVLFSVFFKIFSKKNWAQPT